MKIGVFDSGLGGLIITNALAKSLPDYDYVYLGDTARVPYGNRSQESIYHFTQEAVDYLFANDCSVIITACNTVSVNALVKLQKFDIPNYYPDKHAFGVVKPTATMVADLGVKRVGVIGTAATIHSNAYQKLLQGLNPSIEVYQQATPLLVPLIENKGTEWALPIVTHYLLPLIKANVEAVILGCTHYSYFKDMIQGVMGDDVVIVSQDAVLPHALKAFLKNNPKIEQSLTRNSSAEYLVTDINQSFKEIANHMSNQEVSLKRVMIAKEM